MTNFKWKRFRTASGEIYWGYIPVKMLNSPRAPDHSIAVVQGTRSNGYFWSATGHSDGKERTLVDAKKVCKVILKLDGRIRDSQKLDRR